MGEWPQEESKLGFHMLFDNQPPSPRPPPHLSLCLCLSSPGPSVSTPLPPRPVSFYHPSQCIKKAQPVRERMQVQPGRRSLGELGLPGSDWGMRGRCRLLFL